MALLPWKNRPLKVGESEGSPLASLRNEMDRLLDTFAREPLAGIEWPFSGSGRWTPAVDVTEEGNLLTIRAEVPGMKPEDFDISIAGDQLVLAGEKKEVVERREKDFYQSERRFGSFSRTIPLPESVDPEKVKAEYADGILTIQLEKTPASAAKRIDVEVKE